MLELEFRYLVLMFFMNGLHALVSLSKQTCIMLVRVACTRTVLMRS